MCFEYLLVIVRLNRETGEQPKEFIRGIGHCSTCATGNRVGDPRRPGLCARSWLQKCAHSRIYLFEEKKLTFGGRIQDPSCLWEGAGRPLKNQVGCGTALCLNERLFAETYTFVNTHQPVPVRPATCTAQWDLEKEEWLWPQLKHSGPR